MKWLLEYYMQKRPYSFVRRQGMILRAERSSEKTIARSPEYKP